MGEDQIKPGPVPKDLDNEERTALLGLVEGGFGVQMALKHLKIGHGRYYRTIKNAPGFHREVEGAKRYDREFLVYVRRGLALGDEKKGIPPDPAALEYLINRNDKAERFARERREALRAARAAAGVSGRGDDGMLDLGSLSNDKLVAIVRILGGGERPDADHDDDDRGPTDDADVPGEPAA